MEEISENPSNQGGEEIEKEKSIHENDEIIDERDENNFVPEREIENSLSDNIHNEPNSNNDKLSDHELNAMHALSENFVFDIFNDIEKKLSKIVKDEHIINKENVKYFKKSQLENDNSPINENIDEIKTSEKQYSEIGNEDIENLPGQKELGKENIENIPYENSLKKSNKNYDTEELKKIEDEINDNENNYEVNFDEILSNENEKESNQKSLKVNQEDVTKSFNSINDTHQTNQINKDNNQISKSNFSSKLSQPVKQISITKQPLKKIENEEIKSYSSKANNDVNIEQKKIVLSNENIKLVNKALENKVKENRVENKLDVSPKFKTSNKTKTNFFSIKMNETPNVHSESKESFYKSFNKTGYLYKKENKKSSDKIVKPNSNYVIRNKTENMTLEDMKKKVIFFNQEEVRNKTARSYYLTSKNKLQIDSPIKMRNLSTHKPNPKYEERKKIFLKL